jgi:hemerythrin-like domain-containing protein
MLRKDSSFFQEIPAEKLTKTLLEDHNYTHQHLEILAELMYAEAELNYARNKISDSLPFYQKSLVLFEFVDDAYRTWSEERLNKMNKIKERIVEVRGERRDGERG